MRLYNDFITWNKEMTDSDEFIESQIDYMNWFRENASRMDLVIDNTDLAVHQSAKLIERFLETI